MNKYLVLIASVILNIYLALLVYELNAALNKSKKTELATSSALQHTCVENVKTASVVTKVVKEIDRVEIPGKVESSSSLPPDLKRLLDSAYSDLFD